MTSHPSPNSPGLKAKQERGEQHAPEKDDLGNDAWLCMHTQMKRQTHREGIEPRQEQPCGNGQHARRKHPQLHLDKRRHLSSPVVRQLERDASQSLRIRWSKAKWLGLRTIQSLHQACVTTLAGA